MTNHPITPPPELVQEWWDKVPGTFTSLVDETHLATQAAQWGADQELEACINYFHEYDTSWGENSELITGLRTARRPQPPSLKEQALAEVAGAVAGGNITPERGAIIRKALESL